MRAAYQRAAEPLAYESDIEEDQVAWRAAKLYDLVVPPSAVSVLGSRAPAEGYGSDAEPTLALELGELAQLKLAAISRHVSQTGSAGPFHDWGAEAATRTSRPSTTASPPAPSPSRRAAASASMASSTGSARRSSQRALLRSVGRIGPAWR